MSMIKLIPSGAIVPLRLSILQGGYNDPSQGWTDGLATVSQSGSIYLKVKYFVPEGPHSRKEFRSTIGLKSPKGPWWRKKGRDFVTDILNSKYNLAADDFSTKAIKLRRLKSLKELNGLKFVARIKTVRDQNNNLVNEIDTIILRPSLNDGTKVARLRQTDLTARLTAAVSKPMWMLD